MAKNEDEILNLPQKIAQSKGIKFVICLDEFQDLVRFKDSSLFEKKMRAVWQKQKDVTYCIYGSKRHMMSDIFNNSNRPFYRFGEFMYLQKITEDSWIKFLQTSFKSTGKKISKPLAIRVAELMKCHSWYVQQFAYCLWNRVF